MTTWPTSIKKELILHRAITRWRWRGINDSITGAAFSCLNCEEDNHWNYHGLGFLSIGLMVRLHKIGPLFFPQARSVNNTTHTTFSDRTPLPPQTLVTFETTWIISEKKTKSTTKRNETTAIRLASRPQTTCDTSILQDGTNDKSWFRNIHACCECWRQEEVGALGGAGK